MLRPRQWQPAAPKRFRPVLTAVATLAVVYLYGRAIAVRQPASQAADFAAVIDGVNPTNGAGLRVDVIIDVPVHLTGCPSWVRVTAIVSGTPPFWQRYASKLEGLHRLGFGLRTSYENIRVLDWSGYNLPTALANLGGGEPVPSPATSGRVGIAHREDTQTGAELHVASISDWGEHRTPLVFEFDAAWTSARGMGSCYLVLPELVAIESPAVSDARAAASGAGSIFDEVAGVGSAFSGRHRVPGATTFGRVLVRTDGHVAEGQSRPLPRLVDGNPWVSNLGTIGEEAAIWTCKPPPSRNDFPDAGLQSPDGKETAPPLDAAAHVGCGGLAVIEARNAGTMRDLTLLVIGGVFAFLFNRFIDHAKSGALLLQRLRARIQRQA